MTGPGGQTLPDTWLASKGIESAPGATELPMIFRQPTTRRTNHLIVILCLLVAGAGLAAAAARDAIRRHKQAGVPMPVWRNGKTVWVDAAELEPRKKRRTQT